MQTLVDIPGRGRILLAGASRSGVLTTGYLHRHKIIVIHVHFQQVAAPGADFGVGDEMCRI